MADEYRLWLALDHLSQLGKEEEGDKAREVHTLTANLPDEERRHWAEKIFECVDSMWDNFDVPFEEVPKAIRLALENIENEILAAVASAESSTQRPELSPPAAEPGASSLASQLLLNEEGTPDKVDVDPAEDAVKRNSLADYTRAIQEDDCDFYPNSNYWERYMKHFILNLEQYLEDTRQESLERVAPKSR